MIRVLTSQTVGQSTACSGACLSNPFAPVRVRVAVADCGPVAVTVTVSESGHQDQGSIPGCRPGPSDPTAASESAASRL